MTACPKTAIARPTTEPRPDAGTCRPDRPRDPRRSRRRSASRKTLDRMRAPPAPEPRPEPGAQARVIPDWEILPLAFVLDTDFDDEGDDLALGRAQLLACAVRGEDEDAFWG